MPCEFSLDLCFIREHAPEPFQDVIEGELRKLFAGRGTWYIDCRKEAGLDIAVAEVKGLAAWESEEEVLRYIEDFRESSRDTVPVQDCWDHLQGYQVQVTPKIDAGCCRLQKR
ncbi:hypothetical protein [Paenibacillus hexagrammi]|uniref:ABM domain-containing protein n=1 Tax=Paenibacillus hexagrammi TaxID=2908839 RepID=A0ABY3SKC4_9BACL|nr:hypothetical protein [Paenibacillus sp. YPD9-1]UJF33840.1 hypothetical protein L0M14_00810 [Paenibacillus sp. YPD9-1]